MTLITIITLITLIGREVASCRVDNAEVGGRAPRNGQQPASLSLAFGILAVPLA